MRYYVTDGNGDVVGKFDGVDISLPDGYERHEVGSVDELSEIVVDEWDRDLTR